MTEKLALVVDDSKMARVVLSKMLKEQHIDVDQVESGEEALGYLCNHQPDMIFMDHTMPGMDGFQTLRAIRNDPRHAAIPIMMYTSKEGEVYVSQARALGATAVIPKKRLRADQLVSVLAGQNLLPGKQKEAAGTQTPESAPAPPRVKDENSRNFMEDDLQELTKVVEQSLRPRSEDAMLKRTLQDFREQMSLDLHRDFDTALFKVEEKLRLMDARLDQLQVEHQLVQEQANARSHPWMTGISILLAALTIWLAFALWEKTDTRTTETTSRLEEAINHQQASLEDNAAKLEQELKSLSYQNQKSMGQLFSIVGGVLSEHSSFAWNEPPFNDRIAGQLETVANQLSEVGFRGVITLRSHLGKFCLQAKNNGEPVLPVETTPATNCEISELSMTEAEERGLAQSMTFNNILSSIEARFGEHIHVELETAGPDEPIEEYPASTEGIRAGTWNKVAARNQRLEFTFTPHGI